MKVCDVEKIREEFIYVYKEHFQQRNAYKNFVNEMVQKYISKDLETGGLFSGKLTLR